MWRTTIREDMKEITFVPISDQQGRLALASFHDLDSGGAGQKVFQPVASLRDGSHEFTKLVQVFNQAHDLHFGDVGGATLTELGTRPEGIRYEMAVFYWGGGELRWRFLTGREHPVLLEWYEIHDTAGVILFPMACAVWLVTLPLAIWATRKIRKFRTPAEA